MQFELSLSVLLSLVSGKICEPKPNGPVPVVLIYESNTDRTTQNLRCTGVMISPTRVLSGANCGDLKNPKQFYYIPPASDKEIEFPSKETYVAKEWIPKEPKFHSQGVTITSKVQLQGCVKQPEENEIDGLELTMAKYVIKKNRNDNQLVNVSLTGETYQTCQKIYQSTFKNKGFPEKDQSGRLYCASVKIDKSAPQLDVKEDPYGYCNSMAGTPLTYPSKDGSCHNLVGNLQVAVNSGDMRYFFFISYKFPEVMNEQAYAPESEE